MSIKPLLKMTGNGIRSTYIKFPLKLLGFSITVICKSILHSAMQKKPLKIKLRLEGQVPSGKSDPRVNFTALT